MNDISEAQKRRLWEEVRREFPNDEMMQEIHYVRLLHFYQTKNLSISEQVEFYQRAAKKQDVKKSIRPHRKTTNKVAKVTTTR